MHITPGITVKSAADGYYEPYTLDFLRQHHPHLLKDLVHKWRAETGIELIHEEPDLPEFERIRANWQLMTEAQKQLSDTKAQELFGRTNMEHAAYLEPIMQKKEPASRLPQLLAAKAHSDARRYAHKHQLMQGIMRQYPDEFVIDSEDKKYYGITHTPTGFRMHLPRQIVKGISVQRAPAA